MTVAVRIHGASPAIAQRRMNESINRRQRYEIPHPIRRTHKEEYQVTTNLQTIEIERLREALAFYANVDNYWSAPLSLDINYDRRTLKDVRESEKHNRVLCDRGAVARNALESEQDVKA